MSWNGESRAIKEALRQEHRIEYDICPLCNLNKAHVHSKSEKYNRVTIICMPCAQEWLAKYKKETDSTPADKLHEFLYCGNTQVGDNRSNDQLSYCDNNPMTNYSSTEVEQMRLQP